MLFKLSSTTISLLIGGIGAITGIISLFWHIFNSRSKVILDRISFVRERRHNKEEKEVIHISVNIRNTGNRSTTIEDIYIEIGNKIIPCISSILNHIEANSSKRFDLYQTFTPKEFKEVFEEGKIKLGITIVHTFGILKKRGWTSFDTGYFNL